MSLVKVKNLFIGYGKTTIVQDVSFQIQAGETVGLLGSNGCGKTTLLKGLAGILPAKGEREVLGSDMEKLSVRECALLCHYIPQRSGISMDLSALDTVLMGFNAQLKLLEMPNMEMREKASSMLEMVGLKDRMEENFQTFSEGQKQRVILARTLLAEKGLMLLDEPESAMDFRGRYELLELVREWIKEQQEERAALISLHDPQLALNQCDRLLLMKDGQIVDTIETAMDSEGGMGRKLSKIYGPVSVHSIRANTQEKQYVIVKE